MRSATNMNFKICFLFIVFCVIKTQIVSCANVKFPPKMLPNFQDSLAKQNQMTSVVPPSAKNMGVKIHKPPIYPILPMFSPVNGSRILANTSRIIPRKVPEKKMGTTIQNAPSYPILPMFTSVNSTKGIGNTSMKTQKSPHPFLPVSLLNSTIPRRVPSYLPPRYMQNSPRMKNNVEKTERPKEVIHLSPIPYQMPTRTIDVRSIKAPLIFRDELVKKIDENKENGTVKANNVVEILYPTSEKPEDTTLSEEIVKERGVVRKTVEDEIRGVEEKAEGNREVATKEIPGEKKNEIAGVTRAEDTIDVAVTNLKNLSVEEIQKFAEGLPIVVEKPAESLPKQETVADPPLVGRKDKGVFIVYAQSMKEPITESSKMSSEEEEKTTIETLMMMAPVRSEEHIRRIKRSRPVYKITPAERREKLKMRFKLLTNSTDEDSLKAKRNLEKDSKHDDVPFLIKIEDWPENTLKLKEEQFSQGKNNIFNVGRPQKNEGASSKSQDTKFTSYNFEISHHNEDQPALKAPTHESQKYPQYLVKHHQTSHEHHKIANEHQTSSQEHHTRPQEQQAASNKFSQEDHSHLVANPAFSHFWQPKLIGEETHVHTTIFTTNGEQHGQLIPGDQQQLQSISDEERNFQPILGEHQNFQPILGEQQNFQPLSGEQQYLQPFTNEQPQFQPLPGQNLQPTSGEHFQAHHIEEHYVPIPREQHIQTVRSEHFQAVTHQQPVHSNNDNNFGPFLNY